VAIVRFITIHPKLGANHIQTSACWVPIAFPEAIGTP
jgi:hypothetical protein